MGLNKNQNDELKDYKTFRKTSVKFTSKFRIKLHIRGNPLHVFCFSFAE